jgi:hypothetical protein
LLQRESNREEYTLQNYLIRFFKNQYKVQTKELDFSQYKRLLKKSDAGNHDKMREIIDAKKIFCIPWLICYQHLFAI